MKTTKARVRKRGRAEVTKEIRDRILSGKLKPGVPLRQIALSEKYGVSQTVIRESLKTLEEQGLVSSASQVGFAVRALGRQELVDAYKVREVLEGLAARLCCHRASPHDIQRLQELAHQIRATTGQRGRVARNEYEYEFHQMFLELSSNETLKRVSVGYRFVGNLVVTERDADELLKEHLAIVEAVEQRDEERAEKQARLHISRSAQSILEDVS